MSQSCTNPYNLLSYNFSEKKSTDLLCAVAINDLNKMFRLKRSGKLYWASESPRRERATQPGARAAQALLPRGAHYYTPVSDAQATDSAMDRCGVSWVSLTIQIQTNFPCTSSTSTPLRSTGNAHL